MKVEWLQEEKYDFCIKIRLVSQHNAWEKDKRKEEVEAAWNRLNTIMLSVIELMLIARKAKNTWWTDEVKEAVEEAGALKWIICAKMRIRAVSCMI